MRTPESPPAPRRRTFYLSIGIKMQVLFTVLFTIIFVVVFREAYTVFDTIAAQLVGDGIKRELTTVAQYTAADINGDDHQALYQSAIPDGPPQTISDTRYWHLVRVLAEAQRVAKIVQFADASPGDQLEVYTYVDTDKPDTIAFVATSAAGMYVRPDGTLKPTPPQPYQGVTFRQQSPPHTPAMRAALNGQTTHATDPIIDTQGLWWYSAFAPIQDAQGHIVGAVGIDMHIAHLSSTPIWRALGPTFGVSYVVLVGAVSVLSYAISRPLVRLTKRVAQIGDGDYTADVLHAATARIDDETTVLARVVQQMVDKVAAREQRLVQEVQELKIEIDQSRQDKQVEEITETDYFHDLQRKARELRARAALEETEHEA